MRASALCAIGKGTDADAALIAAAVSEAASDPVRYCEALECLGAAGPPAAPHWELLRDALSAEGFGTRHTAAKGLSRLLPALGESKWSAIDALLRAETMLRVSCIDDPATLVELLASDMTWHMAADRLVELGSACKPALSDALDADDARVRGCAAAALLQIDAGAGEGAWQAALSSPWMVYDLADVCRAHPQLTVPHLMALLQGNDPHARGSAAYLLGELACRDAIPRVRNLLAHDPVPDVRHSALLALDALLDAP